MNKVTRFNRRTIAQLAVEYWTCDRGGHWSESYLTLCILMEFPIHKDTISMGLPSLYLKGSQVDVSK